MIAWILQSQSIAELPEKKSLTFSADVGFKSNVFIFHFGRHADGGDNANKVRIRSSEQLKTLKLQIQTSTCSGQKKKDGKSPPLTQIISTTRNI
jgi:hypothetical protein